MTVRDEWRWTDEQGVQRLVKTEELRSALATNVLPASTMVWREGMKEWAPASEMPELADVLPDDRTLLEKDKVGGRPKMRTLTGMQGQLDDRPSVPNAPIVVPSAGGASEKKGAVITQVPKFEDVAAAAMHPAPAIPKAPRMPSQTGAEVPKYAAVTATPAPEPVKSARTSTIDLGWGDEDATRPKQPSSPELANAASASASGASKRQSSSPPPLPTKTPSTPPEKIEAKAKVDEKKIEAKGPPRPAPKASGAPVAAPAASRALPEPKLGGMQTMRVGSASKPPSRPPPPLPAKVDDAQKEALPNKSEAKAPPKPPTRTKPVPPVKAPRFNSTPSPPILDLAALRDQGEPSAVEKELDLALRAASAKDGIPYEPVRAPREEAPVESVATPSPAPSEPIALVQRKDGRGSNPTITEVDPPSFDAPPSLDGRPPMMSEPRAPLPSRPPPRDATPSQPPPRDSMPSQPPAREAMPSQPPPREAIPSRPPRVSFTSTPPGADDDVVDFRKRRSLSPKLAEPIEVPVSSLLAAGGVVIAMAIAAFFVGRSSRAEERLVAEAHFAALPVLARAAVPPPPKPCWVSRQPTQWAPRASKSIPFELLALEGGALALGYAKDSKEAAGIRLDPKSGEQKETYSEQAPDEIDHVTPMPSAPAGFVATTTAPMGDLKSTLEVVAPKPFVLGLSGSSISIADENGANASALWPIDGSEAWTAARVQPTGTKGWALTFRRGGAVWGGFLGADKKPVGPLVKVAGSGGGVGKPMSAWNGRELAVIFADRADEKTPWEIRIGKAKAGEIPATTEVFPLPKGGPGGDAFAPDLVGLSDGRWLAAWTEGPAGARAVRAQTLTQDLKPIGDPIALSPPAGSFGQSVLGESAGYVAAVFLLKGDSSYELWGAVLQCGS